MQEAIDNNVAVSTTAPELVAADPPTPRASGKRTKAGEVKKAKPGPRNKKQAFMYLGPNIPGGILFRGSVYKELPEHLDGVFKKQPEIKDLFIEVKGVPDFKAKLKQQGSEAHRLYHLVERLIREGALKNGDV